MVLDHVAPDSGSSDLAEYEVPVVETGICHEELTTQEDMPTRWVRSCVELPSWVPKPAPTHSTMLYSMMQVNRAQVVHGRASKEQTSVALRMEPLVIQGPANLTV